jgi:hypothetical protein
VTYHVQDVTHPAINLAQVVGQVGISHQRAAVHSVSQAAKPVMALLKVTALHVRNPTC